MAAKLQGRPRTGPAVELRLDQELLDRLDAAAAIVGTSRSGLARVLLRDGIERIHDEQE